MDDSVSARLDAILSPRPSIASQRFDLQLEEPVIIASDFHVPETNRALLGKMLHTASDHHVRTLILPGDFLNANALASFEPGAFANFEAAFDEEIDIAHDIIDLLFEQFDTIYWSKGNHDHRVLRAMRSKMGMRHLARLICPEMGLFGGGVGTKEVDGVTKRLVVNDLPGLFATIYGERWYITHPAAYSQIPGRLAQTFVSKHLCHVAVAHTHSFAMTKDRSGKFWAIDLGGLFDAERLAYVYESDRPGPSMVGGYFLIDGDGRLQGHAA